MKNKPLPCAECNESQEYEFLKEILDFLMHIRIDINEDDLESAMFDLGYLYSKIRHKLPKDNDDN